MLRLREAVFLSLAALLLCSSAYSESLFLRRTADNHVLVQFSFFQSMNIGTDDYGTFPRSIARLISTHNVSFFDASLSRGLYDTDAWGPAPLGAVAPFGAELTATFEPVRGSADLESRWRDFNAMLGGLLCASFGQIDSTNTVASRTSKGTFVGVLPRESVCTENLTPFLTLLPCSRRGLAALLSPHQIFASPYETLRLSARRNLATGTIDLVQTIVAVLSKEDDLAALFGVRENEIAVCPSATFTEMTTDNGVLSSLSNIKLETVPIVSSSTPGALISLSRSLTETDPNGHFVLQIASHSNSSLPIHLEQHIPPFLALFMHTLTTQIGHGPDTDVTVDYLPSRRVERGGSAGLLSVRLTLPPQAVLTIDVQVRKAWLQMEEHPPDANRGFEVPGVSVIVGNANRYCGAPVLVYLPLPDFSMPYNILTGTSTVVAIFFGYMFNALTRKVVAK